MNNEDFFAAWDVRINNSIELTEDECRLADIRGKKKYDEAVKAGKKDKYGFNGNPLAIHCQGERGELAASKFLGIEYEFRCNEYKNGLADLGDDIEVRTKTYDGKMIVRHDDHDNRKYVHVVPVGISDATGCHRKFHIKGWAFGRDCMKREYLGSPDPKRPPCYNIPDELLRPIGELVQHG